MTTTQKIERMARDRDIRGLCRALRHRDTQIRHRAARALGTLRDSAAVPYLALTLDNNSDRWLHQWSIDALRSIGDESAVDVLIQAAFGPDRQIATLAGQALATCPNPLAQNAIKVRELLIRNDFNALAELDEATASVLGRIMQTYQFAVWHTAKRKQVAQIALQLGVKPSAERSAEFANMGVFVTGLHSIGDLINGIRHHRPEVRIAAAERLAISRQQWVRPLLYQRFRYEIGAKEDRRVIVALARALDELGSKRPISHYQRLLGHENPRIAADAAKMLTEIKTANAVEALFWFIVEGAAQPGGPAQSSNISIVRAMLEEMGTLAINALRPYIQHTLSTARLEIIDLIQKSGHADALEMLTLLSRDPFAEVQQRALEALVGLNTNEAAAVVYSLSDTAPHSWISGALAGFTCPAALQYLKKLVPDATLLEGTLRDIRGEVEGLVIQGIQVQPLYSPHNLVERSISARAVSNKDGSFCLSIVAAASDTPLQLKVTRPARSPAETPEVYVGNLAIQLGETYRLEIQIDRFFSQLHIHSQRIIEAEMNAPEPIKASPSQSPN